jgi:hypothetical protein
MSSVSIIKEIETHTYDITWVALQVILVCTTPITGTVVWVMVLTCGFPLHTASQIPCVFYHGIMPIGHPNPTKLEPLLHSGEQWLTFWLTGAPCGEVGITIPLTRA